VAVEIVKFQSLPKFPAFCHSGGGDADDGDGLSVKALKARLAQHGLHTDGCVEKAELQAWQIF
jgi:hypothetical protein